MSQQIINVGAVANDGTGQSLRTAFEAVNNNFANIWAQGPVDSQVVVTNNVISTNVSNSPLVLRANGIAEITVTSSVVPSVDSVFDLGSSSYQFDTVWARYYRGNASLMNGIPNLSAITTDLLPSANVTFDVGSANLRWDSVYAQDGNFSRNLTVSGNLIVAGNIIEMGNIVTDALTIQLANTATTAGAANGAGITVGSNDNIATMLYNSASNTWVMNIGANITGNVTAPYFIGNGSQLTGITSYANANAVAYANTGWAGNIIPATSNTYSLGNSTNQWSDLYVSNATIYMNNVPISLTSGNVLTVDGADVVVTNANSQANIGNLDINGATIALASGASQTQIEISPNGESWAYLQIPNDATGNVANVRLHNDAGNVEIAAGDTTHSGPVHYWYFDNTGNLSVPQNINFTGGGIQQVLNEDFYVRVSDDEDEGWSIYNNVDDGAGTVLTQTRLDSDGFYIRTDIPGSNYQWNFNGYQGITNFPGNLQGTYGGDTSFYAYDNGSGGMVEMKTISYIGDQLLANVTVRHPNVTISTQNSAYTWTFDGTGNLVLPPSGNVVGDTANNSGHLSWFGNSSGDGNGYTTMRLVPDDTLEGNDQYLIIDPTAPGHIHIRAGGTQDNSGSDLFLGGENSYFKVNAGANNEVRISANSHAWVFGADSILTVPGEGVIRSIQDTVILQSYDINGNTYSARLGTTGGMYFETTEYPLGWLNLTNSTGDANISSPGGSINIDAANGTSGAAGKDINITAGDADQTDYYTTAGGDVNIQGGMGAFNDGGGGGPGGNVNLVAGTSADPAGNAGNVTITSGTWNWQFYNNGNLYVPGQINGDNNGALIIDGAGYGNGYISLPASSFGGEQVVIVNNFSLGNGIALTTNGGTWHFDNAGDLSANGNITGNYFIGNGSQLSAVNANTVDVLNTNGLTTIFYPTFVESRDSAEIVRADVDLTYRTDTNTLGVGNLTVTGLITATGNISIGGQVSATGTITGSTFVSTQSAANEGGEIQLALPSSGSTLTGSIVIDSYQDQIRFFESGGNSRGMFIDVPNVSVAGQYAIGYRDIPQISLGANVTANATNAGKHFYSTTAGNLQVTIPDNANVPFALGATLTIVTNAAGNIIVAQGTGVSLYMAGSATTGNRTVGAYGLASVMKVATDTWVISGTGVY